MSSQYAQNAVSEQLTVSLLSSVQDLVDQGVDPESVDAELRRRVEEAVVSGLLNGYTLGTQTSSESGQEPQGTHTRNLPVDDSGGEESENKRPRTER